MANASMRDRIDKRDYDLAVGSWSPDFGDPYTFMNVWFDSTRQGLAGNRSFYANPAMDQLLRTAAQVSDRQERTALYQRAQQLAVAEAAYVYLYQAESVISLRKVVKGFIYNPMLESIYNLETMSKDPDH
jgi:peptide/nickel transport system substrate-binding protein